MIMSLIFQDFWESSSFIKKLPNLLLYPQRFVVADLKLKKVSSMRMFEINTSRIGKPLKLALEKYGKRMKINLLKVLLRPNLLKERKKKSFS